MIKISKFIDLKRLQKFWFKIFWRDTFEHRYKAYKIFKDILKNNIKFIWITWTNGKSSSVYFLYQILKSAWKNCGFWTTPLVDYGNWVKINNTPYTMPPKKTMRDFIEQNIENNSEYIILECSSQGLNQFRHSEIKFMASGITNITPEHLDYHKTMEIYLHAKSRIFRNLIKKKSISVLNYDDDSFESLKQISKWKKSKIITYSIQNINAEIYFDLSNSTISILWNKYEINLSTYPIFQINNILVAVSLSIWIWIEIDTILSIIWNLKVQPWRFEILNLDWAKFDCIIDYAHTPDGFKNLFESVKNKFPDKKIKTLFWWSTQRDKDRWSELGKIASLYSQNIILTQSYFYDSKNKDELFNWIISWFQGDYSNFEIIEDRKSAIKQLLSNWEENDILLFLWIWPGNLNIDWIEINWNEKQIIINSWWDLK